MAISKIEEMVMAGASAEQIANYLKEDLTPVGRTPQRTAEQMYASMAEQDMSIQRSPLKDLQLAYNKGQISDEMYAEIHQILNP